MAKKAKEPEKSEGKKKKPEETPAEFVQSLAVVLVTGLFIITFILQAFEIPSSSMEDTLLIGDHVFVDRVAYAPRARWAGPLMPYRDIRRNDIVVFLSPAEAGLFVVKRIIGVPGDRLHLKDGKVYLNGQPQDESYVIRSRGDYNPYRDNFPDLPPSFGTTITADWNLAMHSHIQDSDLVVPAGSYFAMGDNRDISYDSRYWGFIPRENIIGRPMFVYWSFETPKDQYQKTSMGDRLAFIGKVVIHFFDQTRWRRMFKLVR
ncbi:MAG: signal peptidase I [Acidobacteriia bacterium]|nr:signal peptidase I [Terriglobia bacterium]